MDEAASRAFTASWLALSGWPVVWMPLFAIVLVAVFGVRTLARRCQRGGGTQLPPKPALLLSGALAIGLSGTPLLLFFSGNVWTGRPFVEFEWVLLMPAPLHLALGAVLLIAGLVASRQAPAVERWLGPAAGLALATYAALFAAVFSLIRNL
ncbi:hypothetical protein FDZ71_00545 [bacterium]|nr:MAG: hypothetical protein FDZ71_00545 [bacterium]